VVHLNRRAFAWSATVAKQFVSNLAGSMPRPMAQRNSPLGVDLAGDTVVQTPVMRL